MRDIPVIELDWIEMIFGFVSDAAVGPFMQSLCYAEYVTHEAFPRLIHIHI